MSEIDDIVSGVINADTITSPREAFGVQCGMAYHTKNTDPFRDYTSLTGVTADGFTSADAAYRMVAAAFAQKVRPKTFRLGRMTQAVAHTVKLTAKDATVGKTVSVTITDAAGVAHVISRVNIGGDTLTSIAAALAALIGAVPGLGAVAAVADITVTATTAGQVFYYDTLVNLDYLDETPDALIDADLSALLLVDDAFYGVTISLGSKANIDKVDAWCEAQTPKKLFAAQTADSREAQSGNSVLGTALQAAKYTHTLPMYHSKPRQFMACAWLGLMFAKDAGSATFALKQLTGVDTDKLTQTQISALRAAGLNYYVAGTSARGVTRKDGTVASGEKADIIYGTDWLDNEIKVSIFDTLAAADKVDFDDGGIAQVEQVIYEKMELGVKRKFLEAGNGDDIPAPFVVPMKVSDVAATDRAARLLSGVQWGARMRGAIHAVDYTGNLSV